MISEEKRVAFSKSLRRIALGRKKMNLPQHAALALRMLVSACACAAEFAEELPV